MKNLNTFEDFLNEEKKFSMLDYSKLSQREQQLHGDLSQVIFSYKNLKKEEKLNAVGGLLKRIESGDLSESVEITNEASKFKSTKDFLDFLEEIDGMKENEIRKIMGKDYIDTPGNYKEEAKDYDNDIEEYMISNMGKKEFEKLLFWWGKNVQESVVNEAIEFSVGDFPIGAEVYIGDEVWKVVKPGNRGEKVIMVPSNAEAKRKYISIAIEFDLNWLNGNVTEIDK